MSQPGGEAERLRLRLRIFGISGRTVSGGRRLRLRLAQHWPWAGHLTTTVTRLHALASG